MRLNLSGQQRKELRQALQSAFKQAELQMLLVEECSRQIEDLSALPAPISKVIFDVIEAAEMQGWTDGLLLGAAAWRPHDEKLATFLQGTDISAAGATRLLFSPEQLTRGADVSAALQGIVNAGGKSLHIGPFLARLGQQQARVCRIEVADVGVGTGFLIADELVLTAQHVKSRYIDGHAEQTRLRFDYQVLADGLSVRPGLAVALADDWSGAESPPAPADTTPGGRLPNGDELDYAVIRLAKPVGRYPSGRSDEGPVGGGRGFIQIEPSAAPGPGSDLFVLQHPQGQPLKLGVGRVLAERPSALRLRHDAPTENGASGAPCFDANLRFVGLHHARDPAGGSIIAFNQAVPALPIAQQLAGRKPG